jgi:hypothetical protein
LAGSVDGAVAAAAGWLMAPRVTNGPTRAAAAKPVRAPARTTATAAPRTLDLVCLCMPGSRVAGAAGYGRNGHDARGTIAPRRGALRRGAKHAGAEAQWYRPQPRPVSRSAPRPPTAAQLAPGRLGSLDEGHPRPDRRGDEGDDASRPASASLPRAFRSRNTHSPTGRWPPGARALPLRHRWTRASLPRCVDRRRQAAAWEDPDRQRSKTLGVST